MAKAKSGLHKTPRQSMQMPNEWFLVAKKMAVKRQQPVVWYLTAMIGEAAKREGIKELPKYPWE